MCGSSLALLRSAAKYTSPDAHDIAARLQRRLKVARHAHTEHQPPLHAPPPAVLRELLRELGLEQIPRLHEPFKVLVEFRRARERLGERADRQEALQVQPWALSEDEPRKLRQLGGRVVPCGRERRDAGLVVFAGGVDLEEYVQLWAIRGEIFIEA